MVEKNNIYEIGFKKPEPSWLSKQFESELSFEAKKLHDKVKRLKMQEPDSDKQTHYIAVLVIEAARFKALAKINLFLLIMISAVAFAALVRGLL